MSFFGPIPTPLEDETSSPLIRRALYRAKIVGRFAIVQAIVQIIGFGSGILLVHKLSQQEYAYFTIANSMQATLQILGDLGISVGLISIGGRVWQDRHRFGQLINTALSLRKRLSVLAILVVTPCLYFLLARNNAPISYAAIIIALVVGGIQIQLSIGVLTVVPRLHSDIRKIQKIDLTGAIIRLTLLTALMFLFLDAAVAIAVTAATWLIQYFMLRGYVSETIDRSAPQNSEDRREIFRLIKHLAPNSIFYCLQGQITVFLISLFARHTTSIAEVGALGRLAMIFTILSNLLANIFVPAFARCQDPRKMRWFYAAIVGGVTAFSLVVLAGARFFPREFLFVLGNKYANLDHELFLMIALAIGAAITGTLWSLNAAKAWVTGSWLYIPLTLVTQIALIPFTNFSSVSGVLIFNLISIVPNLFLNAVLTYRGFRSLPQPAG